MLGFWEQLAGGFCSREDDGRPFDVDPTARDARTQMGWAAAELGRARLRSAARANGPRAVFANSGPARAGVGPPRRDLGWAACLHSKT